MPRVGEARPCLHEEGVGVAVVAAGELDESIAMCKGSRKPHRGHRGLGARGDEPDPLDRRHRVDELCGQLDLSLGRCAEAGSLERRLAHCLHGLGVGVPEDQRPPGLDRVEQEPAIGRLEVGAVPAGDEERLVDADRAHGANRRVDTARDQRLRAVPELAAH